MERAAPRRARPPRDISQARALASGGRVEDYLYVTIKDDRDYRLEFYSIAAAPRGFPAAESDAGVAPAVTSAMCT